MTIGAADAEPPAISDSSAELPAQRHDGTSLSERGAVAERQNPRSTLGELIISTWGHTWRTITIIAVILVLVILGLWLLDPGLITLGPDGVGIDRRPSP